MMRPGDNTKFHCTCNEGKTTVPHWMADVESMEKVTVTCPICQGKYWLTADEWDRREAELNNYAIPADTITVTYYQVHGTVGCEHVWSEPSGTAGVRRCTKCPAVSWL